MSSDSDSDYGDTEFITSTIRDTTAALKTGKQNLRPTLPTATGTLSERGAVDVRFGLKKEKKKGPAATPTKKDEKRERRKETPKKDDSINITPPSTPSGPRQPAQPPIVDVAEEEEGDEENAAVRGRGGGRRSKRIRGQPPPADGGGGGRGHPPAKRGRGGRKPRMTKAERQAQLAKQQMESALVSLTRNDSFGREDIDDEEDVEEVSDDDEDSFSGQFMVKVEWKLDIFRLPVFPSDRLGTVLDRAAKHVDVDAASVQFVLQDETLRRDTTVAAKGISIASILEMRAKGGGGGGKKGGDDEGVEEEAELDEGQIHLKFRTKDRKSEVKLVIGLAEKFSVVMKQYAEQRGVALKDLKFVFDGEVVSPNDTPEDLDLEGEECIDVF